MHGSTSPAKKGLPSKSHPRHVPSQSHPFHVTRSRTRPTARRASSLAGSRPISRSSDRTCIVEFHPWFHAAPAHDPSAPCRASSRAPRPSVATFARSAATSSAGAPIRSRITCQRIEGSESSSHCMTDLFGFGACRLGGLIAICWFSLLWLKDAVGNPTVYGLFGMPSPPKRGGNSAGHILVDRRVDRAYYTNKCPGTETCLKTRQVPQL